MSAEYMPGYSIPHDVDGAIVTIREQVRAGLEELKASEPDPLAPIGKQIAHLLAVGRAEADIAVMQHLISQQEAKTS